jgi:signal transduction histidine kinase
LAFSVRPAVGRLVETISPIGHWLFVAAGLGLMALSELVFFVYGTVDPTIRLLELLLPMAVGAGLVWFGFESREHEFTSWQIAVLGLAVLLGMAVFVVIATYMRVLLSLEQALPQDPLYLLVNAMAIGAVINFAYAYQYVKVRERADRLEVRTDRLVAIISRVSHDLRNPLNVAQGYADILGAQSDGDRATPLLNALDRIETMIDELLVFSHRSYEPDDPEPVALDAMARESWQQVDTGDCELQVETEQVIRADPDRLQHLFENLYRNAVEHAGPTTVRVGVLADRTGFYVADDGPGIPPADRESVFEAGFTTEADGTGLGLDIVAEICAAHEWTVSVTESAGGGARFEVESVVEP